MSSSSYLRNFIFGVEDSLVSTVGLVSGVAVAGVATKTIILTGIILIFVEAFSMAVGSILSDNSVREFKTNHEVSLGQSYPGGLVMFVSYFVTGFIPLAPYLFVEREHALWFSIGASLVALFALGAIAARLARISVVRNGLEMLLIGGLAIAIGVTVGSVVGV